MSNCCILPKAIKLAFTVLIFEAYGFGHYIEKLPNGMLSISHGGQGNGIMTHLQAVPEGRRCHRALTNSQRSWPFIAYVLSDWAQWRGFPSVGMGRIIWGHYGLCVVIGMLISASLLVILRLVPTFYQQKRMGVQTASSWSSIYSSRDSNLVRLPEILIYNFGFPDSVCMAWGRGICVLYSTAVVCAVTRMAKEEI